LKEVDNVIEEFNKYVDNYDMNNNSIRLKYNHSFRVMELQVKYAKMLNWSDEDIEIAKIIGLLHDFGRFEQIRVYNTFDDTKSIDHADYSVEELFTKGNIKKFCTKEEWYPIIKFAIQNHNKYEIAPCDDERMIMHAKLIRDTDKIDILYLLGTLKEVDNIIDDSIVNKEVIESINEHKTVYRDKMKTKNDRFANKLAFAYDIYYDCTLSEVKENLRAFYEEIKDNKELLGIFNTVNKYIDERIE
jgi:hypothetical protein